MTLDTVARYDQGAVPTVGSRAVVVGASVAGLVAARALADGFEEVVLLERDPLPNEPAPRDGAPQTHHPHALLEAGRATLEDFFPGFGESLLSNGGLLLDAASEAWHYEQGGYLADAPERMPMYCASRPLFELVLRERIRARSTVDLRDERQFADYQYDAAAERVTGVEYRGPEGERNALDADLVVDATGRTSRTPAWLGDHGYPTPAVDEVQIDVEYATTRVERPPDDRRLFLVPPSPPRKRGIYVLPTEGERWEVLIQGIHGTAAPRDRQEFEAIADEIPPAEPAELVSEHNWVDDELHHYPFPASRRVHYEHLDRFPDGLAVVGDAVASFNPIYGQGMSVAALDGLLLHHTLASGGLDRFGPRYFDRTEDVVDEVWQIAIGSDFEFSETTGPKPLGTDAFNAYLRRLLRKAHTDPVLSDAFKRVLLLERSASSLLGPRIVARVLRPSAPATG
ncbi:MAG: FAD-dependent oxidoreductase [Halanaeroarchaeum sp.]